MPPRLGRSRTLPRGRDVSSGTHRVSGQDESKPAEGWGGEKHVPDSMSKGWGKKEKKILYDGKIEMEPKIERKK